MLLLAINVNAFLLTGMLVVSAFIGYMLRRRKISQLQRRITELEKEVLSSHAEILEIQAEKAALKNASASPVIPLRNKKPGAEDPSKADNSAKKSGGLS